MTHISQTGADAPNGKLPGRHVRTSGAESVLRQPPPAPPAAPGGGRYRLAIKAMAVISVSTGMIATVALPSYADEPEERQTGGQRGGGEPGAPPQTVVVSADAEPAEAGRDEIGATTVAELEAKRKREEAERRAREAAEREAAAREAAERAADSSRSSTGAGAPAERSAAAPTPPEAASAPADGGSIVSLARQFLGVPYVFGGASPSGFDCSGLILYVYAKFGISLPHSSLQQAAGGVRVSDPVPGDLVVLDGGDHIGIYTGGGDMIDSPMPGRVVNERPIYTANHYFVRY